MLSAVHAFPDGVNLVPAAAIRVPISWFEDRGVDFHREQDDLDTYRLAAFRLPKAGWIALMQYDGNHSLSTTLMIDTQHDHEDSLQSIIAEAADAFGLPVSDFRYKKKSEEPVNDPRWAEG